MSLPDDAWLNERARGQVLIVDDPSAPLPAGRFDTVVLADLLVDVEDPAAVIADAARRLVPGGRLLVSVPLGWHPERRQTRALSPSDVIALCEPAFGVDEVDIAGDRIRAAATAGRASSPAATDPARLLREVERNLLATQKEHARQQTNLGRRADDLAAQRHKLERSGTHQLGALLVGLGKRPQDVVRLPDRLAALSYRSARAWWTSRQVYRGRYRIDLPAARPIERPVTNRVLHLLEYSLPHHQNGYTLRSMQVVKSQRELGWEPIVVTRPGFPRPGANGEPERLAGIPHYRLPGRALDADAALPDYTRAYVTEAARVVEQVQPALLCAGSNFRNAYAAIELARHYRLPFVYEVRGLWEETRVANGSLRRGDRLYQLLVEVETYCMQSADAIVTLNQALRDELVRRGVAGDKIFLVPNAVDVDAMQPVPPRPELRHRLGLDGKFVVAYLGSVSRLESLHILVEAISVLARTRRDVAALVVGGGGAIDELIALAARLGVADLVRFTGAVPHAEVADYYALSDVVACTRAGDRVCEVVTPLKPYEAMAYRKPVIVSDLPALAEMVKNDDTGRVFPAGDAAALARIIAELADDPARCAALAERAHAWVCQNRRWRQVTEGYRAAYDHARAAFARR